MKLITIPPYKGFNYTPEDGRFIELRILENLRRKGQLDGVVVDLDDGYEAATGTKTHRLKVAPRVVMVLGSDSADGSTGYVQGTFSLVDSTKILYSVGGKAYARILANK